MTIHEPATLATDYLLALLAGWCGWRLGRRANPPQRWWSRALCLTAASAVIGGTHHGFGPLLGEGSSVALWCATLLCISLTSAAMAMAFVEELAPPARRLLWQRIVWIKFAGFAALGLALPIFLVAVADYGLAMFALAFLAHITARAWRTPMLAAIALSALAAVVQQLHWGLSARFNHNDVYHLIQGTAVFLFYRAGKKLAGNAKSGK